jgi:transposase
MNLHANAELGLAGRVALVRAIEDGLSLKAAAAAVSVSPATAHRWWHRWLDGGRSLSSLRDRSSRPHRSPRQLSGAEEEPIVRARRQTSYPPGRLAGIVRRASLDDLEERPAQTCSMRRRKIRTATNAIAPATTSAPTANSP